VRAPAKEAENLRERRQAGAAAQATQDKRQAEAHNARTELEKAKKGKTATAEADTKAAAEKAAAKKTSAKKVAAEKAAARIATNAASEKVAAERTSDAVATEAAAAALVALDRLPSLPVAVMSLTDALFDTGRREFPESTIGGQTTCIVCFVNLKSHAAVPCGHQCACDACSAQMRECPVCRNPAREWIRVRVA
tara:strand:- start:116 stop:697 length:582 start_codon:yes stop_codon:yes gene_type:complete